MVWYEQLWSEEHEIVTSGAELECFLSANKLASMPRGLLTKDIIICTMHYINIEILNRPCNYCILSKWQILPKLIILLHLIVTHFRNKKLYNVFIFMRFSVEKWIEENDPFRRFYAYKEPIQSLMKYANLAHFLTKCISLLYDKTVRYAGLILKNKR